MRNQKGLHETHQGSIFLYVVVKGNLSVGSIREQGREGILEIAPSLWVCEQSKIKLIFMTPFFKTMQGLFENKSALDKICTQHSSNL